jgi:NitT/TauT family transport system substrate-binding protein
MRINYNYMHYKVWPTFLLVSRVVTCLLVSISILASCSEKPESPLRIGTNNWSGYEPLHLANSLKFYDGSPIKLVELNNASDVIRAMRLHSLEGAALTLDEVMVLLQDGLELSVILVMDVSNGGDVLLAKPEIETLADLRGKKIAVEHTAVGAILLDATLEAADLSITDVAIVTCTVERHESCYASNDAVVTFEPMKTHLLNLGAHQLFDSSQIEGRIVDVLVVHKNIIESHHNSLQQLLAGYFQALDYLKYKPEDAAIRMSRRLKISPDEVLASFEGLLLPGLSGNKDMLNQENKLLQTTAVKLAQFMLDKKLLEKKVSIQNLTDNRFLSH